jgi:hypothetical protein
MVNKGVLSLNHVFETGRFEADRDAGHVVGTLQID